MLKTLEVLKTMEKSDIVGRLNYFLDENGCCLSLSKECRDYLADQGIYGPYKKLHNEIL